MKLLHTGDLHLGKRLHETSLADDQRHMLTALLGIARAEAADAILISGDVYDRASPPGEAVRLFDDFLVEAAAERPVFVVTGNHDSADRLGFGGRLLASSGVYISPPFDGTMKRVTLRDAFGEADVWLLPFLRPAEVKFYYPEAAVTNVTEAVSAVLARAGIDFSRRNVLLAHQYVAAEAEVSVGGLDAARPEAFEGFDYVALGHIHRAYPPAPNAWYCGSPLKYAVDDWDDSKSVRLVTLGSKGDADSREVPVAPLRDLRRVRGRLAELIDAAEGEDDYIHAILTDEEGITDALARMRAVYPRLVRLDFEARRAPEAARLEAADTLTPLELFAAFWEHVHARPLPEAERAAACAVFDKVGADERPRFVPSGENDEGGEDR